MDGDQLEGVTRKYAGKAQSMVGDVIGDENTQAEGMVNETTGAVQQAYGSAKDAAGTVAENFSEILKKIQAQLTELTGQLKESAGSAGTVISDKSKQAAAVVGEQVQESPVTSLMIVGAVGYLLGFLSSSSRR